MRRQQRDLPPVSRRHQPTIRSQLPLPRRAARHTRAKRDRLSRPPPPLRRRRHCRRSSGAARTPHRATIPLGIVVGAPRGILSGRRLHPFHGGAPLDIIIGAPLCILFGRLHPFHDGAPLCIIVGRAPRTAGGAPLCIIRASGGGAADA